MPTPEVLDGLQDNELPPRSGRDALAAHERKVLARMRFVSSRCVRPVFVSGDYVVIRSVFEFEAHDGTRTRLDELAYQRWEGDPIIWTTPWHFSRRHIESSSASSVPGSRATRTGQAHEARPAVVSHRACRAGDSAMLAGGKLHEMQSAKAQFAKS
jgi:hypothetical protein